MSCECSGPEQAAYQSPSLGHRKRELRGNWLLVASMEEGAVVGADVGRLGWPWRKEQV